MAGDIGVDRLCWELTDHPEDMFSRRFVPGTPDLAAIKHEIWDDNNLGNAIPGATPRARIDVARTAARPAARRPRRTPVTVAHRRSATSRSRPFPAQASYGRRSSASARSSAPRRRASSTATSNAPGCRRRCQPASSVDVQMTLTAPEKPGRYGLKFDLVSEGIDWFEACGSETTTKTLVV